MSPQGAGHRDTKGPTITKALFRGRPDWVDQVSYSLNSVLQGMCLSLHYLPFSLNSPGPHPSRNRQFPAPSPGSSAVCLLHILTKAFKIAQNSASITMDTLTEILCCHGNLPPFDHPSPATPPQSCHFFLKLTHQFG